MPHLRPCTECQRHVRGTETRCPFCDGELAPAASACAGVKPLTRAAILFGAATTLAACTTDSGNPVPAYGVPPVDSPPVDSGIDARADDAGADDAGDSGGD